jgi:hypothetical protein
MRRQKPAGTMIRDHNGYGKSIHHNQNGRLSIRWAEYQDLNRAVMPGVFVVHMLQIRIALERS